ncbi:putative RING-H2 finger protein ATL45 [Iris pallida]|uniref:RING-H2 finger protein ATL45 n=1 Tax=Iris pallida TaxID=29817 RepID=A0AAX6G407_IRIPA|nr:putative RING-H2 finger protein ATL45 [Iris pallida]KAJ6823419.1 putative RING-H2 finger protein ATL45 [Iris pallida]
MGFPSIAVRIPKPLVALLHFLNYTKHVVSQVFFYTGVLEPSVEASSGSAASPSSIKSRLPVVEFSDFSKGCRRAEEEGPCRPLCAVCLMELEGAHRVRELGNCSHAFHKGCIDKWVDVGNVTCPLCRAQLLPKGIEEIDLTTTFR